MARTPDAPDNTEATSTRAMREDTALSLDPGAAPILRKTMPEIDEKPTTRRSRS